MRICLRSYLINQLLPNRLQRLYRRFSRGSGCWSLGRSRNRSRNRARNSCLFEGNILLLRTLQYLGGYNRRFYYSDILRVRNLSTRSRFNTLLILFHSFRLRIILVIRFVDTIAKLFLLRLWLHVTLLTLTGHPGSINLRYLSSFLPSFIIIVIIIFAVRNSYYYNYFDLRLYLWWTVR